MDIGTILKWIEATSLATHIRNSLYVFPMLESFHVVGLALVFGTIAVIDLRLLGRASAERPFQRVTADILKWTWAGFLLAAVTGLLMFTTNATVYYHNLFFRLKMLLLLLAAVNMGAFELSAGRRVEEWGKNRSAPPVGRVVAVLSLVIWVGVIFAGRAIGFTTSRAKEAAPAVDVNFDDLFQGPPAKK